MDLESLESELESKAGEKPSRDQLAKASGLSSMQLSASFSTVAALKRMVAANLRLVVSVARSTPSGTWNPGPDPGGNHRSGAWRREV